MSNNAKGSSTPKGQPVSYSEDKHLNSLLTSVVAEVKSYANILIKQIDNLVAIGQALSAEKNLEKLLEMIVDESRMFTNADAGTLYIKENNILKQKIIQNKSMGIRMGGTTTTPITSAPVELTESNVSGYVALKDVSVNIPDVYNSDLFDFTGPRKFDAAKNYRTKSMLAVPMKNHENDVIGVLQLINAIDPRTGEVVPFSPDYENLTHSLASQAAVAITNVQLIQNMENLFNSFVKVMATAIDEKSPVTAGHILKVRILTIIMAKTINEQKVGHFANINFNEDQLNELRIAAWMHDIGKVATPVHIVEKGNKLEDIFDRIHYVSLRFLFLAKHIESEGLRKKIELQEKGVLAEEIQKLENDTEKKIMEVMENMEFIKTCNEPGEFMDDEKIKKLECIARITYEENGEQKNLLSEDELLNLSIRKGSITEAEREIMKNHAAITLKMLEQIPFTKKLKNVTSFAGAHHECINGKGYPKGLKGDEIPLEGRLLAVTDIAEALTASDRPYKKGMPLEEVHRILGFMVKDGNLDPDLVDLFVKEGVYEKYIEELKKNENGGINLLDRL